MAGMHSNGDILRLYDVIIPLSSPAGVRNMKPYIELNLVVPQAAPAVHKRKFVTSNKSGTASPNFNQSFQL